MKKLLFTWALGISILLSPSLLAKEIQVQATGRGQDYDWAIMDAIENAVRQTSEVTVTRDAPMVKKDVEYKASATATDSRREALREDLNASATAKSKERDGLFGKQQEASASGHADYTATYGSDRVVTSEATAKMTDNSKSIDARYQGKIKGYEVLSQEKKDGLIHVTILATVFQEDVYDPRDYKSKDLVKKSSYSLAVMPFDFRKGFNCLGQKVSEKEFNTTLSNLLVEKITSSKKFNLVDRDNQKSYEKEMAMILEDMTLPENQTRLRNMVSADYILVGSVENFSAVTDKKYLSLTDETIYNSSASIKISYRLLETATMEIISSGSSEKTFNKDGQFSSCYNVENHLLKQIVTEAMNRMLVDVFPDYKPQQEEKSTPVAAPKKAAPRPVIELPFD